MGRARFEEASPGQMAGWRGGEVGQCWAVTPGNLSNESVEAAGEVATGLVARLVLHHGN